MSAHRPSGKSVRFNEGSQQTGSSRHHRREDERDSGLGSSSSEHTSYRRGRPDWGFTAADRHYQSHNPDAVREAYDTLLAENQRLQDIISKHEASLSTSHRTIKQLESHTAGLVTEKDELKAKNNEYKDNIKGYKAEIAKLQSENEALHRDNLNWQAETNELREQMIMRSVVSDQMSGASGASGTSGSSNKITRRPSQRESQDERLKDRLNRNTQNNAQVASTSAIQPTPQRQRRLSRVNLPGPPYIEDPEPARYNLVSRPAPGHQQERVPRSSHQNSGDYYPHPLPQETPRRR